jgi:hypothetical protein
MKVISAAIIACAAAFSLTNVALAQNAPISTTRSNIKRPQKTNQPIVTKDVDNITRARPTTSRPNKRSRNGVAVGDFNGDGVSSSRSAAHNSGSAKKSAKKSSTIFDRWGKTR